MGNLGDNYWQAIREAAEDVAEQPEDEREDSLDGWADSYTIYTHDALTVLLNTRNDDAAFEQGVYSPEDIGQGISSMSELYSRVAWFAVREDIREEMPESTEDDDEDE